MAKGGKALEKYLSGKAIPIKQAVYAKCYECMGNYRDGKFDCDIPKCTLYPWMPYKGIKDDRLITMETGKELKEERGTGKKRILSPEHLAKMEEGRRNRRDGVKKSLASN